MGLRCTSSGVGTKKQHLCIVPSSLQIYRTSKSYNNLYPFWLPLLQLSFGLTPALTGPVTTQVAEQKSCRVRHCGQKRMVPSEKSFLSLRGPSYKKDSLQLQPPASSVGCRWLCSPAASPALWQKEGNISSGIHGWDSGRNWQGLLTHPNYN